MTGQPLINRREYLLMWTADHGVDYHMAREAVSSVCLAHPEWDLTVLKTYREWENSDEEK